jgi:Fe-S cluster biosynthesis and repair protein YggX
MNENRLSPAVPEHYERLMQEMRTFLRLGEG